MDAHNTYPHGCAFPPGSLEKLRVLEARARLRLPLFQANDVPRCELVASCHFLEAPHATLRHPARKRLDEIEALLRSGASRREIAARLGCCKATVATLVRLIRKASA